MYKETRLTEEAEKKNDFKQTAELDVITFNLKRDNIFSRVLWDRRKNAVCDFFRNSGAQIIGVQELLPEMKSNLENGIADAGYKIIGNGRDKTGNGEHTDIIYSEKKLELKFCKTFWLSKDPESPGSRSYMTFYPRIATAVKFALRETNIMFYVYNTHLDHISPFARAAGADIILSSIKAHYLEDPLPVIVMGDFNSRPSSATVKKISEDGIVKLHNVLDGVAGEKNTMSRNNLLFHGRQIDYIMVSDGVEVMSAEIVKLSDKYTFVSDHNPLKSKILI